MTNIDYSQKTIDSSKYSVVEISKCNDSLDIDSGHVLVPYIFSYHTEESLKEHKEFMSNYHNKHKYCPKCGSETCRTSMVCYCYNSDKPDEYKDLNRSVCTNCNDLHRVQDRVSHKI